MMRRFREWGSVSAAVVVLLILGFWAGIASAQTFRGSILGTVTDSSGGSVAGAQVSIRNVDTGVVRTEVTDADGSYRVPELPIGTYEVTVSKESFEASVTSAIKVDVAAEVRVDAILKPGAVSTSVTVSGESLSEVETTTDVLGETLTQETMKNIPVNGRDYTKLIYLTPGVAGSPDQITDSPGSFGVFSMNGARGRSNNFLLDGTDMNDGYRNDPAINEAGVFGTPATILPIDAVAELRVLSNYEPEYGRNAGAVINIVTKSGTNAFHGDFFDYLRNNVFDARNFFNTTNQVQAPFRNNQFGGSLGGPIIKNKAFFFFDYEGQREAVGVVSQSTIPTVTSNTVLTNGGVPIAMNPVIQQLLARNPWSLPANAPACTTFDIANPAPCSLTTALTTPSYNNVDSLIAKVDYNFNQNNVLTGRYYFGNGNQAFPLALTGGGVLPGFNTVTPTRVQLVALSYVTVFSSTKVNEARFGWNRFAEQFNPQDQSFAPSSIGLDTGTGTADQGLPVINVGSFAQIGASHSDPRHRVDTNWQAVDNFSWQLGKHDVKFGYEFRRTSIAQFLGNNYRGKLGFADLSSFLQGDVDNGGGQSSGDSVRNTFQNNQGLYIQDSYRATSRLTLNVGLRWDYFGVITEKNNLFSSFDTNTGVLIPVGPGGLSNIYNPDYNNFAPRVSVAWDVTGKGKTVVRAGIGYFYDAFSQDFFLGHLPYNCSFCPGPAYNPFGPEPINTVGVVGGTIVSGQPVFQPVGTTPSGNIFVADHNLRTPYMANYNLNIEQQLTSKLMLQLGYVGSNGHKLMNFRDINQPTQAAITASDLSFLNSGACVAQGPPVGGPNCITPAYSVPNTFGNPSGAEYINQEESSANSNYNAFQASLRLNNWHGFTSIVNYVWSHSLDNASDGEDFVPNAAQPNNSQDPAEYGNSNFDIRNRFTWIYNYQLPHFGGGWQKLKNGWGIDGTLTLQDGQPFNLNYNFESDFSGSGEGFDRPDVLGTPVYNSSNPNQFLQLGDFAIPCTLSPFALANGITGSNTDCLAGTRHFGNEGRNSLRGPSFKQFDFALYKDTAITERLNMQLRVEFFNLFNHPNFSNPLLPAFIADPAQQGFTTNGSREVGAGAYAIAATGDVGIGNPFLGGGGPRGIQFAAKFSF
jgi:outer membrane receptor protein involved in Fe transport